MHSPISGTPTFTSSSTRERTSIGLVHEPLNISIPLSPRLPKGVEVELAKDATAVGWVYQYALVDTTGQYSIDQIRSFQDWYLRYDLQSVPGVAEVAPVGGLFRQYQVNVDPNKLLAYKIPINMVSGSCAEGEQRCRRPLVEITGREYMVRGRGYNQIARWTIGKPWSSSNPQKQERPCWCGPGHRHLWARHAAWRR